MGRVRSGPAHPDPADWRLLLRKEVQMRHTVNLTRSCEVILYRLKILNCEKMDGALQEILELQFCAGPPVKEMRDEYNYLRNEEMF